MLLLTNQYFDTVIFSTTQPDDLFDKMKNKSLQTTSKYKYKLRTNSYSYKIQTYVTANCFT